MNSSTSVVNISKALLNAQRTMGNAKKDSNNPYYKSSYADLNSIREVAIPALNSNDITVLQPTVTINGKNYVQTLLLHVSGEWLSSETEVVTGKPNDPQAHGSGLSYARRYGLQSFLNIGAVDDDAESSMSRSNASTTATTTAPTTTPATKSTFRKPAKPPVNSTAAAPPRPVTNGSTAVVDDGWDN